MPGKIRACRVHPGHGPIHRRHTKQWSLTCASYARRAWAICGATACRRCTRPVACATYGLAPSRNRRLSRRCCARRWKGSAVDGRARPLRTPSGSCKEPSSGGATERRKAAAKAQGVSTERFRKGYEPMLIEQVAEGILAACHERRTRKLSKRWPMRCTALVGIIRSMMKKSPGCAACWPMPGVRSKTTLSTCY